MSTTLTKPRVKKTPVAGFTMGKLSGSGVVSHYVHGALEKIVTPDFAAANLFKIMEVGLPVRELTDLQTSLAVPADRLAPMLGISKATFHRRKSAGSKLNPAVSDRNERRSGKKSGAKGRP